MKTSVKKASEALIDQIDRLDIAELSECLGLDEHPFPSHVKPALKKAARELESAYRAAGKTKCANRVKRLLSKLFREGTHFVDDIGEGTVGMFLVGQVYK